jgi:hyaluronan synthase
MFPNSLPAFFKQRVRWSRNSYRCYLTSIGKGWLWRQPFITQVTVLQVLLTPFSMATALVAVWFALRGPGLGAGLLAVGWVFGGRTIRGFSHLREHPRDLLIAPVVALVVIVVALPVKTWALVTMNTHGWLTRKSDRLGGEGQDQASLATTTGSSATRSAPTSPPRGSTSRRGPAPGWSAATTSSGGT